VGVFVAGTITAAAICTGFLILMGALNLCVARSEAGDLGFHALLLTSSYPVDIFAGATKALLYTVVPAGFMTAASSQLVDEFDSLLATVAVGTAVFNVGLRRYTSGSVWTSA
jgi:ABC-2 type transport system permease protein